MKPEIFDIFLITGQSNSSGAHDNGTDEETQRELSYNPYEGTAYCLNVDELGRYGDYYDLSVGRDGFSPALARRWNELTGRGVFVIQTAVAGSPIERWAYGECPYAKTGKNLLDNTIDVTKIVLKMGWGENPQFKFGDVYYFWCQGETSQAHEWMGDGWKMPGIHIMDTDTYYQKFMSYHFGLLSNVDVKAGAVMLVRSLPRICTEKSRDLGLLTDNNASKQAQYTAHAENSSRLRIMSRISEIARMEKTPGPGAGYMLSDNVHYSKKGYNHQGRELAENLYNWVTPGVDKTATGIEWFEPDCRTRMKNGTVLKVDALRGALTSACVLPLWAENPGLSFEITENDSGKCHIDKYGKITFDEGTETGTRAKIKVKADAGFEIEIVAECAEPAPFTDPGNGVVTDFIWDFKQGTLNEYNSYNNLTPDGTAPRFTEGGVSPNSELVLQKDMYASGTHDWSISWRGNISSEQRLFEGGVSRLDTCLGDDLKAVRYVSTEGQIFTFEYPKTDAYENLRLAYTCADKTLTLYSEGKPVSSCKAEKPFSSRFHELLRISGNVIEEIRVTLFVKQ